MPDRDVTLTRQSNGTYTLTLPIQQVSKMGVTGYLSGLTIGDVTYTGTVSGDGVQGHRRAHHQEPARLGADRRAMSTRPLP